jgi:hypothetical protein
VLHVSNIHSIPDRSAETRSDGFAGSPGEAAPDVRFDAGEGLGRPRISRDTDASVAIDRQREAIERWR